MARLHCFINVILLSLFVLCLSSISNAQETVNSEHANQIFSSQVNSDSEMAILVKENKRCIRCHKKQRLIKKVNAITNVGAHSSNQFKDNCTACHGNKGSHPKDDASIISFSEHSTLSTLSQNEQCISCHTPEALRQAEWTHDVHYKQIYCASCHSLHTEADPINGIENKRRIEMCVDCHKKDQALNRANNN